jgi:hypothetical protein
VKIENRMAQYLEEATDLPILTLLKNDAQAGLLFHLTMRR